MKLSRVVVSIAAALIAVIAVAPTASAAPAAAPIPPSCNYVGGNNTVCQTPGNVQVNSSPSPTYGGYGYPGFIGYPLIIGGFGGHGFGGHGGFGGGHGGGGGGHR